jgi:hypothetical protein
MSGCGCNRRPDYVIPEPRRDRYPERFVNERRYEREIVYRQPVIRREEVIIERPRYVGSTPLRSRPDLYGAREVGAFGGYAGGFVAGGFVGRY